jgi:hypothetical protein
VKSVMKAMGLTAALVLSVASHAFGAAGPVPVQQPTIGISTRTQQAQSKPEVISRLKTIMQKQSTSLQSADQTIRKLFEETQVVRLGADQVLSERQIQSLYKRLATAMTEKEEVQLRYDFLSQLIFQVDSKWGSEPLQDFLSHQLLEMAITDASSANSVKLWKFYSYLSIAVREIPEKREDLISFIDAYIDFSTILEPKSPAIYVNSRNYTNGAVNQSARAVNRDQLGAVVEKKMKELESIGIGKAAPDTATAAPSASATSEGSDSMEIRTRVPQSTKRKH